MDEESYRSTVKSLGVSIFLLEAAIAGAVLLLIFTLQDSIRVLSILGIWDKEFGAKLWMIWPILAMPIIAIAWAEFVFVPRAKAFLTSNPKSEKFGGSTADELAEVNELRSIVNKYAIFLIAESLAIGMLIGVSFLNVILVAILIISLLAMLVFFRAHAKTLKAEKTLLT